MRKITMMLLVLFVLVSVSSVFAGGRGARDDGVRVMRAACNQPDGYPTVVGLQAMADYVYRESGGRIRIEVFNNAVLGQETESVMLTQMGEIEFNRLGVGFLASVNPQIGAFGMPGIYRDREHMFRVLNSPIGDEALMMMEAQGLIGLAWMDAGFRNFYNRLRPVRVPADIAGMNIRMQPVEMMMELARTLGINPVPASMGEVYSVIQTGMVDGAENNWPSYASWSHYEVARYFTVNRHNASPEMILISASVYRSLSPEDRRIIRAGALHGGRVQQEEWIRYEAAAEARVRAAGSVIIVPTPEEQRLWDEAIAPMHARYPQFADIIRRIRAIP